MTSTRQMTVAISFARSAFTFAEQLSHSLIGHGFRVISDDPRLGKAADTWGTHRFTLIDQVVDQDVTFCIVLLTPDFKTERWSYRHCRLIEATQARKGFLLPVRLGDHTVRIRGITEHLGDLSVKEDEWEKVAAVLVEKAAPLHSVQEALEGYADIETILQLYNPRLELRNLDEYEDRTRQIGYELYEARDTLIRRSTFFLHLYRGINTSNTSEHVLRQHGHLFKEDPLIILIPKEPAQTQRQRRLDNIRAAFNANGVHYIDHFIWDQCTDAGFRTPQPPYDLQTFIDPNVRYTSSTALDEIEEWSGRAAAPVLIIQGSGGIGKTTVAKAFANKLISRGGHRVLFVDDKQIIRYILQHQDRSEPFTLYHAYLAYADSSDGDNGGGTVRPDLFRANFDSGNITMILDGMDEVVSRVGTQFSIRTFLDSIYPATGEPTDGKVIITCRAQFLAEEEIDPNVNTIELLPFDEPLATRYFQGRFPGLPKTVDKGLAIARKLMRADGQDAFIPFVLDQVAYILHEKIESAEALDDPVFRSEILAPQIDTDYIVGKVCQREHMKYPQALSPDAQVRFFIHLAVECRGIIRSEELPRMLAAALTDHRIGSIERQAMLNHPLLRMGKHSLSFRYDLLLPYFQALAVSQVLREAAPLTPNVVQVLGDRTDPQFILDCSARFGDSMEALVLRLLGLLEQVQAVTVELEELRTRAVSGLFLIGLHRLRASGRLSRESATELLRDLFFQDGRVYRAALYGPKERFVFDFSGLCFESCVFSGYDAFWECTFDRATYFRNCELMMLHLSEGLNTSASGVHFDLYTCRTDDTVQRVLEHRSVAAVHADTIRTSDLVQFLRLFYQRGHMMPQKEAMLKGRYRGHTNYSTLVSHLRDHGFIESHVSHKSAGIGPELGVVAQHKSEAVKFCIEGTMSAAIKGIIKAFPE